MLGGVAALSAPGGTLDADLIGEAPLRSAELAPMLRLYDQWGAPWRFGTEDPAGLFRRHAFCAAVTRPGEPRAHYGRWSNADLAAARVVQLYFVHSIRTP